tara:strand:+ start:1386 stop:1865 length:480 start_codon:yes stop_codon:yes gene_type:complete
MSRPITKLVPDIRKALQTVLEETVQQVYEDVYNAGPYWSGQFANNWEVLPGKRSIRANIPTIERPKTPRSRPAPGDIFIPESPNLGGYSLGNRSNYRLYAMDIKPTPTGRRSPTFRRTDGKPVQLTSAPPKRYWYDKYLNSQIDITIRKQITSVFRRYS